MTVCDFCGKLSDGDRVKISIGDRTLPSILGSVAYDVCSDCRRICLRVLERKDLQQILIGFLREMDPADE